VVLVAVLGLHMLRVRRAGFAMREAA
jgi:hypothetical protein